MSPRTRNSLGKIVRFSLPTEQVDNGAASPSTCTQTIETSSKPEVVVADNTRTPAAYQPDNSPFSSFSARNDSISTRVDSAPPSKKRKTSPLDDDDADPTYNPKTKAPKRHSDQATSQPAKATAPKKSNRQAPTSKTRNAPPSFQQRKPTITDLIFAPTLPPLEHLPPIVRAKLQKIHDFADARCPVLCNYDVSDPTLMIVPERTLLGALKSMNADYGTNDPDDTRIFDAKDIIAKRFKAKICDTEDQIYVVLQTARIGEFEKKVRRRLGVWSGEQEEPGVHIKDFSLLATEIEMNQRAMLERGHVMLPFREASRVSSEEDMRATFEKFWAKINANKEKQ